MSFINKEHRAIQKKIADILAETDGSPTKAVFDTDKDPEADEKKASEVTDVTGTGKKEKPTVGDKLGKTGKAEH